MICGFAFSASRRAICFCCSATFAASGSGAWAFGPRLLGVRQLACIASTTPLDKMRRVQTFTTEESTELAPIARVGFLEDPPLELGGELPALGLRRHFRRGAWSMERVG